MIFEDLPFDVLLGCRTCKKWKGNLCWDTDVFEVQPSEKTNRRVRFDWQLYTGQHWRKPVTLIADYTIRIGPESQTTISVRHIDNQWQVIEPKSGLVTPVRGK